MSLNLRQLALERNLRTGEMERHEREVSEYNKIMAKFDRIVKKLIKDLKEAIIDLNKFQSECIKTNLIPELNKIIITTRLLHEKSPSEIIKSLDSMKSIIKSISRKRKDCEEETNDNYTMYADVSAKIETLQDLSQEKYAEYAAQLQQLRDTLEATLNSALQMSLNEFVRSKGLIIEYFSRLNDILLEKGPLFDYSQFTAKYSQVKLTYQEIFGEILPVDIQFTMDTEKDEEVALALARKYEMQGY